MSESQCAQYTYPASMNDTLIRLLNDTTQSVISLVLPPAFDKDAVNSLLSNIYCAGTTTVCHGICSNADLAGIGVRIAFWLSSTLQAVLVAISPEDSMQGAWTTAVLTASIVIPAIIQKKKLMLTLYHATLVLNFATFSSLVSLAVAPMCTVWREGSQEEEAEVEIFGEEGRLAVPDLHDLTNLPRRKVHRQRLVLSLALLAQVSLQWTWAVMLFTDTQYAQTICSPGTKVLLFGYPFTARQINTNTGGLFIIWPMWLLFCMGTTLIWGTLLVLNSSETVHPVLSRSPSRVSTASLSSWSWWKGVGFPLDRGRILVLGGNVVAFLVAALYLITSELQAHANCIRGGENNMWSFGQVAALLLALAPAWPIAIATAKWYSSPTPAIPLHHGDITVTPQIQTQQTSQYFPTVVIRPATPHVSEYEYPHPHPPPGALEHWKYHDSQPSSEAFNLKVG